MATLTPAQIAAAAKSAGFSGSNLQIAVAVALAESGGNPRAHNRVPPDNSYGLWQINMLGNLGPARRQQFGLSSNDQLFDPATNAKAAWAISSRGTNWRPWSVYLNGAYRMHMNKAAEGVRGVGDTPVPGDPGGGGSAGGGGGTPISWGGATIPIGFTPGEDGVTQVNLGQWLIPFLPWLRSFGGDALGSVPGIGPLFTALSGVLDMAMVWTAALVKTAAWISRPENWVRVAQVGLGAALVISGTSIMARPFAAPVVGEVEKVAKVTAKKGKK